jgi:hypothetical protein
MGHLIQPVCAGKGDGRIGLIGLEPIVLFNRRIRPSQAQAARRELEIGRQDELPLLAGEIDRRRRLHGVGNELHANPTA